MNRDVPQPMTPTRSPGAGSLLTSCGESPVARLAALDQQSGWE
jgi:hypothetical protein